MPFKPEGDASPQESWTEDQVRADIVERSNGNAGAMSVLAQLSKRGPEIYFSVALKLGTGPEVWDSFQEAGGTIDGLINRE